MAVCAGIKRSGGRCTLSVETGELYCHHHDPDRSEERRRAASKAGRSKPNRELADIKRKLCDLADDVLEGNVDRGDGAVASQILNVYLRAVSVEMKAKEAERAPDEITEQAFNIMLNALEERLPREEFEHAVYALAGIDGRWW